MSATSMPNTSTASRLSTASPTSLAARAASGRTAVISGMRGCDILLPCDRPGDTAMIDRRLFIGLMSAAAAAPAAFSQQAGAAMLKRARTSVLEIAYEESGPESGFPVLLMHGFPYDPRAFDE